MRPIEPIRGNILDRNGTILAESFDTFDIVAKKEKIVSEENFIINAKKVFKFEKLEVDRLKKEFKKNNIYNRCYFRDRGSSCQFIV